jgi:hypothetical protein
MVFERAGSSAGERAAERLSNRLGQYGCGMEVAPPDAPVTDRERFSGRSLMGRFPPNTGTAQWEAEPPTSSRPAWMTGKGSLSKSASKGSKHFFTFGIDKLKLIPRISD